MERGALAFLPGGCIIAARHEEMPMTKGALAMAANDAFADIVDFVEEHGGSLGGEQRDELYRLVAAYARSLSDDATSNWAAGRG
jgi:hypothetical protein